MLFLQRQSEAIDDGAKNLEELSDAVESLSLVNELEENVVDGAANVRTEIEEFTIYAMKRGLEKVAFTRVLRVE